MPIDVEVCISIPGWSRMKPTPTPTLIVAMRVLSVEIQSDDGVATAAIAEAADRLERYHEALTQARASLGRNRMGPAHRIILEALDGTNG